MKLLAIPNDATSAYGRNYEYDFLSEFNPLGKDSKRTFDEVKFLNWKDKNPEELFGIKSFPFIDDKGEIKKIVEDLSKKENPFGPPLFKGIFQGEMENLDEFLREYNPNVVRAFNTNFAGELGAMIKERHGLPLVISAHDPSRLTKIIEEADSLVCISEDLKETCLENYQIGEEKIKVIPDGVDMDFFYPRNGGIPGFDAKYKILSVGRIVPSKNIGKLLESIKYVKEELGGDIKHIHLGKGSEGSLREIEELRDNLGLGDISHFLGGVQKNELPKYYSWADVYSLPTLWEGLGRAQIESLACGTPVLTTNYSPMSDIVMDGHNGFVFDPQNSEDIAEKTIKYFKNPELRKYMEKNSRRSVKEKYSAKKVMEMHSDNYKELVRG